MLKEIRRSTGDDPRAFPSVWSADGFVSPSMYGAILRSIRFAKEITPNGFRSIAATLLSERGWNADAIDQQVSHADPDRMRRTYNFGEYLPERRRMMQAWADHLDKLEAQPRRGAVVTLQAPLQKRASRSPLPLSAPIRKRTARLLARKSVT